MDRVVSLLLLFGTQWSKLAVLDGDHVTLIFPGTYVFVKGYFEVWKYMDDFSYSGVTLSSSVRWSHSPLCIVV